MVKETSCRQTASCLRGQVASFSAIQVAVIERVQTGAQVCTRSTAVEEMCRLLVDVSDTLELRSTLHLLCISLTLSSVLCSSSRLACGRPSFGLVTVCALDEVVSRSLQCATPCPGNHWWCERVRRVSEFYERQLLWCVFHIGCAATQVFAWCVPSPGGRRYQ